MLTIRLMEEGQPAQMYRRLPANHFTVDDFALGGKWVELLKQIAPATTRVALLFNPAGPSLEFFLPSIQAAASSLNVHANLVTIYWEG